MKEAVTHIVPLPADTLPGTKFKYGGLAMQVAGRMAEVGHPHQQSILGRRLSLD